MRPGRPRPRLAPKLSTMSLSSPAEVPAAAAAASVAPSAYADVPSMILIAPNVSEQMGGEAIKALHVAIELVKRGVRVHQITHSRVGPELTAKHPDIGVTYIRETSPQSIMWRSVLLRPLLKLTFQWKAARVAAALLRADPGAVVHYTSPVSPVLPAFQIRGAAVVIGPLNGNIFYPPRFRHRESWTDWFRRVSHNPLQVGHRLLFRGKQTADALLVAGGDRTYRSLRLAGCREEQFVESLDSGILDRLHDLPRARHSGVNLRFVQNGRLVDHKGTDLVIRALARTANRVELTVIGRGPERGKCERLAAELNVADRVTFIEWVDDHSHVATMLQEFRAFVFPSLAEANGIVVQEAMMLGLPVVALDWGGPSLLVTPETGILIPATDEPTVVSGLADALDRLATDGDLAERFSIAARDRAVADGYLWKDLIERWIDVYRRVSRGAKARG